MASLSQRPARLRAMLLLLPVWFFSSALHAQNAQLSGTIRDQQDAAVPNASIGVQNTQTQVVWSITSNREGIYTAAALPPGTYRVTVESQGFDRAVAENLRLETAGKTTFDFVLKAGNVTESVTVDASGIQVNTTDASVSTVVDHKFVENMPLNGRSFQALLSAVPGVTIVPSTGPGASGEITVNGQRTEANYFTVDGVSANNGSNPTVSGVAAGYAGNTPGQSTLGTTHTMVTLEALNEFRALTSSYSAEYGRSSGGQFSFTTRSGTNDWHGNVYDYIRNDALGANQWFNGYINPTPLKKPAERQNDFGATLSGPIRIPRLYNGRDRSFFLFAYEGLRLRAPQQGTAVTVPNMWLRNNSTGMAQAVVRAFPQPDDTSNLVKGNGLAVSTRSYSNPSSLDSFSLRVDHSLSDRWKFFARAARTPNQTAARYNGNLSIQNTTKGEVKLATLGLTGMLSPTISNDLRFNITGNDSGVTGVSTDFAGATPYMPTNLPGVGGDPNNWLYFIMTLDTTSTRNPNYLIAPQTLKQRQFNIVDWTTKTIGRHSLKFGFDYRRTKTTQFLPKNLEYAFFYSADQVVNATAQMMYLYRFYSDARPVYHNGSAFLQDEWRASNRLSISAGVRYDVNPAPYDAKGADPYTLTTNDLASARIAPRGTPLWNTKFSNFAPRLGLAYIVHTTPGWETTFRIGGGLFYDTGNSVASRGYNGGGISNLTILQNVRFPATQAQFDTVPQPSINPPYNIGFITYDPNLRLPRSAQWNVAVEQAVGSQQTFKLSYVGSAGRQLTRARFLYPRSLGNTNFLANAAITHTANGVSSNYAAMQVEWQRRMHHGLQVLAAYTWSHSMDGTSTNFNTYSLLRADSDFDIRNNFQAAVTYEVPNAFQNRFASAMLGHWASDLRFNSRSALPIDVIGGFSINPLTGEYLYYHPSRVPNQPLYLSTPDSSGIMPAGGRRINAAAFSYTPGVEGNAGRNIARGFNVAQMDLSVRRDFPIHDQLGVQFRIEAFNLFNHPIFGSVYNQMNSAAPRPGIFANNFGYAYSTLGTQLGGLNSLYQTGGPRSMQVAMKIHF